MKTFSYHFNDGLLLEFNFSKWHHLSLSASFFLISATQYLSPEASAEHLF